MRSPPNLQDHLQEYLCLRVNRTSICPINSMVSWDAHSFVHLWLRHPFKWSLLFFGWTVAEGVWREGPPKGQGSTALEMALWARKIICLPAYQPNVEPDSFEKQNCSFHSWVRVGRVWGRAEETELLCVTVWQPHVVGGLLLCKGRARGRCVRYQDCHAPVVPPVGQLKMTSGKLPFSACLGYFFLM